MHIPVYSTNVLLKNNKFFDVFSDDSNRLHFEEYFSIYGYIL